MDRMSWRSCCSCSCRRAPRPLRCWASPALLPELLADALSFLPGPPADARPLLPGSLLTLGRFRPGLLSAFPEGLQAFEEGLYPLLNLARRRPILSDLGFLLPGGLFCRPPHRSCLLAGLCPCAEALLPFGGRLCLRARLSAGRLGGGSGRGDRGLGLFPASRPFRSAGRIAQLQPVLRLRGRFRPGFLLLDLFFLPLFLPGLLGFLAATEGDEVSNRRPFGEKRDTNTGIARP